MPKMCRIKVRTKKARKRRGFCGNKDSGDVDANEIVNTSASVYNDINIDENETVNNVNKDIHNGAVKNVNSNSPVEDPVNTSVSERKVQQIEPPSPFTPVSCITGNRIIDMDILSSIISQLLCPSCKAGAMKLSEVYEKKQGLASFLLFQCTNCSFFLEEFTSKTTKNNAYDINTRTVYTMRSCGQGYAGLERFTSLMNLPKPMTPNNFDKIVDRLVVATKEVAEETMQDAATELKTDANVADVAVSCDGSWQKRGYSSMNGVVTVISMKTGKILDIEPMSRVCKACGLKETLKFDNPDQYEKWKADHICKMNYKGSAGNMEPVGAKRMWDRSVEKNGLRYITFYGDGDSKSYETVCDTYPNIKVEKLECVGHVQKRVGCRLRSLKKREKGIGGKGKLTNSIIDRLQNYYGIAIRSNKNNLEGMQAATRAALFHVASSKDHNYHYPHCPTGPNSWCRYNRDQANGTSTYRAGAGLPLMIILKLKPIFHELGSEKLLKKCLHGLTQNQNESFNSMIWDRLLKTKYASMVTLTLCAYDAVANFNIGKKASILVYEKLHMVPGKYTLNGCRKINRKRLFASSYANLDTTKKRRKIRRGKAKSKDDKNDQLCGKTYEAGAF